MFINKNSNYKLIPVIKLLTKIIYQRSLFFVFIFFFSYLLVSDSSYSNQKWNVLNSIDYAENSQDQTIIIYLSDSTKYKLGDVSANNYEQYRIYIDFKDTQLSKQVRRVLDVNNSIVKRIRCGQFDLNTARVVFDLSNDRAKAQILSYNKPNRVEISFIDNAYSNLQEDKTVDDTARNDTDTASNKKSENTTGNSQTNQKDLEEAPNVNGRNGETVFDPDAKPPLPIKIKDYVSLGGKINLNLDWRDNSEDLDSSKDDTITRFESQLTLAGLVNLKRIDIYAEGRFSDLQLIEDELDKKTEDTKAELRRAYIHWRDFAFQDFDFQVGRQRFKDDREWIYDENLDAFRIFYKPNKFSIELSASSILIDIDDEEDKAVNYVLYSQYEYDKKEKVALFAVVRQDRNGIDDTFTFGASWRERPFNRRNKIWLDNAVYFGRNRDKKWTQGYGIDLGFTKSFKLPLRPNFTIACAFGSKNFRQTGLEDNSSRFKGVTNFKYYGEVFDPELANLFIGTLGLGIKPYKKTSIDFVYHYFSQIDKRDRITNTDIDPDPTGNSRDIGHEIDLIFGTSIKKYVRLAIVGGIFFPVDAFEENDPSYFGEIELQFSLR